MTTTRVAAALEALDAGLRAEHADDLQRALHHYADAAIRAGDDPAIVARALVRQAAVYRRLCEWQLAADYSRRAHELAEDADLVELRAEALMGEGNALLSSGRLDEASGVYRRLLRLAIDDRQRGIAMQNVGHIHAHRKEFDAARRVFEESRALFTSCGYVRGEAIATNNMGRLAYDRGELSLAEVLLQRALVSAREVEDAELAAIALLNLGQLRVAQGALSAGATMVTGAHEHFLSSENRWRQVECLCVLADIAEREGRNEEARAHLEQGREIARAIDARVELERIESRLSARTS
jgi:tetratricopeptide (TPR) repeat protein